MAYEIRTCCGCGNREPMDLPREARFAGECGPLCDDCLPLARLVVEANAANQANAPADPAILALAKFGAMVCREYSRVEGFIRVAGYKLDSDADFVGVTVGGGHYPTFAPGIADAIAALLAPDGAGDGGGDGDG